MAARLVQFGVPTVLFVITFVVLLTSPSFNHLVVLVIAVIASYVVRFIIVFIMAIRLPQTPLEPELTSVLHIDERVLRWATDDTTWPAIWELTSAFRKLEDAWATDDEALIAQRQSELDHVAEWTGYALA